MNRKKQIILLLGIISAFLFFATGLTFHLMSKSLPFNSTTMNIDENILVTWVAIPHQKSAILVILTSNNSNPNAGLIVENSQNPFLPARLYLQIDKQIQNVDFNYVYVCHDGKIISRTSYRDLFPFYPSKNKVPEMKIIIENYIKSTYTY